MVPRNSDVVVGVGVVAFVAVNAVVADGVDLGFFFRYVCAPL